MRFFPCLAAALLWAPSLLPAAVIINEINYAPSDSANPAEFVELWNTGASAVSVAGWQFDAGITYTFPAGASIAANGYLVISNEPAKFAARWGFTPLGSWTGKLSNEGEQLRLKDAAGAVVDSVTYGVGFPWPTAAAGDGSSMELINASLDRNLGGSWRASGQPAGASQNQIYVPPRDLSWRYRKGTSEASNPTSAWRNVGFTENATWLTGQTSIGFGDNDDNTVLNDMLNGYTSVFLRRGFTIPVGQKPSALTIHVRVDDGCIVWINGTEVARFHVNSNLVPRYNSVATDHEADPSLFESVTVTGAGAYLVEGANVVAVQAFNSSIGSSDFTIDAWVESATVDASTSPTPGAVNSCYSLAAPPAIRQVVHLPAQPTAGQSVTVTAKITDAAGVAAVALLYQTVNPGAYIAKTDSDYATSWTSAPMYDDGTHGDALAGDGIYSATLPATVQTNRRLVRYRISASNASGNAITVPYADDASPNFAYFVYNGAPAWTGAFNPGTTSAVTFPASLQNALPTYQLLAKAADVDSSQYDGNYNGQRFPGTLIYNGTVYDHVQFNNRGEASTYVAGKNKWRFHFNTAHDLQAIDNWGRPYPETWNELNLNACASPWCAVHRGMSGVEEAVSLRFYELLGVASSKSNFLHFRVIDDAAETGTTQFQGGDPSGVNGGDLWGLYLAVESPDGAFLDARGLADGNSYKIEGSVGDLKHQGDNQPSDGSDWSAFLSASKGTQTEAWWRANLDLPAYYNFVAGNRVLGNVDLRPGYNHYFYHAPDGHWAVIPWDLDMMFIPKSHQAGYIDQDKSLNIAALRLEYQNRAREVIDLMTADSGAAGGQIGQLIDEYAKLVAPTNISPNWTQLDAAMWNYNPRTSSNSDAQTNHRGNFYTKTYSDSRMGGTWLRTLATPDFAGSMAYLLGYATDTFPAGQTWAFNNGDQRGYGARYLASDAADTAIPARPAATYLGASNYPVDDLRFSASAYSGANAYAATQWRMGEISAPGVPLYDSTKPRVYEVTDVWRSAELTSNTAVTVPPASVLVGHTYRVRVRHKDTTGRWSRWSNASQFVAASARSAILPTDLVISEIMYNPPALSAAETAAGYTDKQLFEYIQLLNISAKTLNLEGMAFTNGIGYTFGAGVTLAPGERILAVKSAAAFALRYGNAGRVVGEYTGNLDNSGEQLALTYLGQAVQDFAYSDGSHPVTGQTVDPWPTAADGNGASLVLMNPTLPPDESLAINWRPSIRAGGSPGQADLINFTEWSRRFPGVTSATADNDGDGWSNFAEYSFGASPLAAGSRPGVSAATGTISGLGGSYWLFTYTRSNESGDVNYFVDFSSNMTAWTQDGVLISSTSNAGGTVTEVWRSAQPITTATPRIFARARAQSK